MSEQSTDTYRTTRAYMTNAELKTHHVGCNGRNYAESDDGWSDMEAEAKRGWKTLSSWGRDGWDLGDWPYVTIQVKRDDSSYQLQQIVEGDRSRYTFGTEADLHAALDYLFMWYSADKDWSPVTWENREHLDAGALRIEAKFRGPVRFHLVDNEVGA